MEQKLDDVIGLLQEVRDCVAQHADLVAKIGKEKEDLASAKAISFGLATTIKRKEAELDAIDGGAFWRELSRRRIKIGVDGQGMSEVPNALPKSKLSAHQPTRNPDARLNHISAKISENPTERALFSWSCLAAEIVHECKLKPSHVMNLIAGNAYPTLHKTLGKEGIRRTISNAFRHVEEKYLAEEEK